MISKLSKNSMRKKSGRKKKNIRRHSKTSNREARFLINKTEKKKQFKRFGVTKINL